MRSRIKGFFTFFNKNKSEQKQPSSVPDEFDAAKTQLMDGDVRGAFLRYVSIRTTNIHDQQRALLNLGMSCHLLGYKEFAMQFTLQGLALHTYTKNDHYLALLEHNLGVMSRHDSSRESMPPVVVVSTQTPS